MRIPKFAVVVVGLGLFSTLIYVGLSAEMNHQRREANVIGKWYYDSGLKPPTLDDPVIELRSGGTYYRGDETGSWSYYDDVVTMRPQSGVEWTYQLSEDGKHLQQQVTDGLGYEKRP